MVDMSTLVGGPRLRVYRDALGIESGLVSHLLESLPLLQMPTSTRPYLLETCMFLNPTLGRFLYTVAPMQIASADFSKLLDTFFKMESRPCVVGVKRRNEPDPRVWS